MECTSSVSRKLLLAVVLAFGAQVAWMIFLGISATLLESLTAGETESEHLQVKATGEVFRNISSSTGRYSRRKTLEGVDVEVDRATDARTTANGVGFAPLSRPVNGTAWLPEHSYAQPTVWEETLWWIRRSDLSSNRFYLECYSVETNHRTGCLSRAGFSSDRPSEDAMWVSNNGQFRPATWNIGGDVSANGKIYLPANDGIWRIDFESLKTDLLLPGVVCDSVGQVLLKPDRRETPRLALAYRQAHEVHIVEIDSLEKRIVPVDPDQHDQLLTVYTLTGNRLLMMLQGNHRGAVKLVWIEADGKVSRSEQVTLKNSVNWFNNPPPVASGVMIATTIPSPAVITAGLAVEALLTRLHGTVAASSEEPSSRLTYATAGLLLLVISTVSTWLCARHATRFHVQEKTAWCLFVFLFGLMGLLAYWWHRRWPVLSASEWVATGRATPPALKGIEVFA